jgi:hypothetical protein
MCNARCWVVVVRIGCYTFRAQIQSQCALYITVCGTNITVDTSHLIYESERAGVHPCGRCRVMRGVQWAERTSHECAVKPEA